MTHHETKHETTMMITPILGHPSWLVGTPIHLSAWYYHAQGAPSPPLADQLKYHHGHSPLDDDGPSLVLGTTYINCGQRSRYWRRWLWIDAFKQRTSVNQFVFKTIEVVQPLLLQLK